MTKTSRKLTAAVLALAAAACIALGVLFAIPKTASAAVEAEVTINAANDNLDYLNIENGVLLGLKDEAAGLLNGKTFAVEIPDTAGVTAIGDGQTDSNNIQRSIFGSYSAKLVKFTMPSGVTRIGNHAFYNCTSLADISIPASVTEIGKQAFQSCTSLEGLYFESVTGKLSTIGESAFFGCTSLKGITVPVNVKTIGETAFSGCSSVVNINYYATAANAMLRSPFENSGKADVVIGLAGNKVTQIPNMLFKNTNIKKVTFDNVEITLEGGMGQSAFENCASLTTVDVGGYCKITKIRDMAFKGCTALSEINLGAVQGLETIGKQAFQLCSSLLSLEIPATVESVEDEAFSGCTALLEVKNESSCGATNANGLNNAKYFYTGDNSHMVASGDYTFFYYENTSVTPKKTEVLLVKYNGTGANPELPENVTLADVLYTSYEINSGAFKNNTAIMTVDIPDAVSAIGKDAFYGCTSLKGIEIPKTVNEVGEAAFFGCTSLETAVIEDAVSGLSIISAYTFGNCTSLKEIVIPRSVTDINSSAFAGCTGLVKVTFKTEKLARIDQLVFSGCTKLEKVYLPAAPRYTGYDVFKGCSENLILIAPDKNAYADYSAKTDFCGGNVLTYEIPLELHSGKNTQNSVLYFGVEAELPVQEGYISSVWYENDGFTGEVNKDALNAKLNNPATESITLHAKDTPKPKNVSAKSTLTYNEGGWNASEGSLYIGWENNYGAIYKVVVSRYLNVAGEPTEVEDINRITDAGTYYLSILIKDEEAYGQWKDGVPVTLRVVPALLSTGFEGFEWGVAKDGNITSLAPSTGDARTVYVYDDKPYFEKQYEGSNELSHEDEYEFSYMKSYLDYISSDYEVVLKGDGKFGGSSQYIKNVVYYNNTGRDWGVYSSTALVTVDNNYRLPTGSTLDDSLKSQGVSIEQGSATNEYYVYKTWFIIATDGNKLLSQDKNSSFTIADWTYSAKGDHVVEAPVLMYGTATDENTHFVLKMYKNENDPTVVLTFEFDYTDFGMYVNAAMPAAYYTLAVKIDECKYEADGTTKTSAGADYTFRFTVEKANWDTLLKSEGEDGTVQGYIDYQIDKDFLRRTKPVYADYVEGQYNFGDLEAVMPVLTLKPEQLHPLRTNTIWADEEYDAYYTGFVVTYRLFGASGSYETADKFNKAPSDIGEYVLNYNVGAPSYDCNGYDVENTGRSYTLYIRGTIGAPGVYVEYTGESWAYGINFNSKYYEVVYLDGISQKAKDIKRELKEAGVQDIPEEDDKYIYAGSHKVVLIFHSEYKQLARWNEIEFSKVMDGTWGTYAVFTFNIAQAENEKTQSPRINWWTWGSYDEQVNAPQWSTKFVTEYDYRLVSVDGSKTYYYNPNPEDEREQGFDKADAGDYWLKPIALGNGNVKEFNTLWLEDDSEWFFVHIEKATIAWGEKSAPKIDSWKYGEDKNYSEPEGTLDGLFSSLQGTWTNYFCTYADYVKILEGSKDVTTYPTFAKLQEAGLNGFVAAGNYVYVYELAADEDANYNPWREEVYFSVLKADNYWDITPVIHDWAYGDDSASITYKPHFGDVKDVDFLYRLIDANGVPSGWVDSIAKLYDKSGQLPIGKYEYVVSMPATANYEINPFSGYFYVTKNVNSWESIPTVIGWSEGGYKADKNMPEASSRFGTVYFTVIDANGNAVNGLEHLTADELNAERLNSLGVGTYKLVAEVEETVNYEKLYAEASFAVFEDSVGMTGIIAATAVFAVIAVGLAIAGVIMLIRKNKKIEEEFRKMVNSELKRR